MKKILALLFIVGSTLIMHGKDLKILALGNSFSICVGRFLPAIVNASGDNHLLFASMFIGGRQLDQHWEDLCKAREDASYKPYQINIWDSNDPFNSIRFDSNFPEMITREKWDIITIQQASHFSWKPETYEPFAGNIIDYIHQAAPQAEIVVQQTWSYRKSDPRFTNNEGHWNVDQTSMFECLKDAYAKVTEKYGLRYIPVGEAVQIWRHDAPESFVNPTKDELAAYKWPDTPNCSGDVVGNYWWSRQDGNDNMHLTADNIHLNERGEYLQACVWFLKLFGGDINDIKFIPAHFDGDFARGCQRAAAKAVAQ